ncbi:hypothetical protein TNCV_3417721 [Trichonephila clavipes]|nr:hypothetical protein TNCV_3417721 [Trichonephila clavipes]
MRKTPTGSDCPIILSKEFITVDDDNVCTAPIIEDNDILEFVQASKNSIGADSVGENEINNAPPVSTVSEMSKQDFRNLATPGRIRTYDLVAAVAEWYRYRIVACLVTSSSPVPLKTHREGKRCTVNPSRAETSSRWCDKSMHKLRLIEVDHVFDVKEQIPQMTKISTSGHQTCLSINRLWHELCDMLRRLVGTTAPGHHDCSIQE